MTEHEQRMAIAEWMGVLTDDMRRALVDYRDDGRPAAALFTLVPDYVGDLNAVHEAEKALTRGQKTQYIYHLQTLCGGQQFGDNYFATAAQRAEALLRCLNLWKEP